MFVEYKKKKLQKWNNQAKERAIVDIMSAEAMTHFGVKGVEAKIRSTFSQVKTLNKKWNTRFMFIF